MSYHRSHIIIYSISIEKDMLMQMDRHQTVLNRDADFAETSCLRTAICFPAYVAIPIWGYPLPTHLWELCPWSVDLTPLAGLLYPTSTSAHPMSQHNFDHAPSTIFFAIKIGVWSPGSNSVQLPFFPSRKYEELKDSCFSSHHASYACPAKFCDDQWLMTRRVHQGAGRA